MINQPEELEFGILSREELVNLTLAAVGFALYLGYCFAQAF